MSGKVQLFHSGCVNDSSWQYKAQYKKGPRKEFTALISHSRPFIFEWQGVWGFLLTHLPDGDLDEAKEGEESEREVGIEGKRKLGLFERAHPTGIWTPDLRSGSRVCKPLSYAASNTMLVSKRQRIVHVQKLVIFNLRSSPNWSYLHFWSLSC